MHLVFNGLPRFFSILLINHPPVRVLTGALVGVCEHYAEQPERLPDQSPEEHQHEVLDPGEGSVRGVRVHGRQPLRKGN